MNDFTTSFTVHKSPADVFAAINDVRGWWGGDISGETEELGDVFIYEHLPQHRSVQRVTESVPGELVVWHVDEANLSFVDDATEWTGTDIVFDLSAHDGGTTLVFSHRGLVPEVECYEACSNAWGTYINGSLRRHIDR